jgi:beta-glucosidase
MRLTFPTDFFWGSSTAAAQIETASDHAWRGFRAKDGSVFERTTDHELRRSEDAAYIAAFGTVYRCGVDWARLQTAPNAAFTPAVVAEYVAFFEDLTARGMKIMFVMHHFTNPNWFEARGSWLNADNNALFLDYVRQCIAHFGQYVHSWNTFNEPNVYAMNAFVRGVFPPQMKSYAKGNRALRNMGAAHSATLAMLRQHDATKLVGISLNTAVFEARSWRGVLPAKMVDWWFMTHSARHFEDVDFWGLSYYAYMLFDPFPISEIDQPGQMAKWGIKHDKMWGYKPEGLLRNIRRFWEKYQKPIVITENGICTDDDAMRIQAIKDYLQQVHIAINTHDIKVLGYVFWSTFDNFEWDLGNTYRFGLVKVDMKTCQREMTEAGDFFSKVTKENMIEL